MVCLIWGHKGLCARRPQLGCDYYTYIITRIQVTNAKGTILNFDEQGESECGYYYGMAESDPDLDSPRSWSDYVQEALDRQCYFYGEKDLFVGGEWKCQPAGKERILALCANKKNSV